MVKKESLKHTRITCCLGKYFLSVPSTDTAFVSVFLSLAGTGVRYQVHGDQRKIKHQCGECELTLFLYLSIADIVTLYIFYSSLPKMKVKFVKLLCTHCGLQCLLLLFCINIDQPQ